MVADEAMRSSIGLEGVLIGKSEAIRALEKLREKLEIQENAVKEAKTMLKEREMSFSRQAKTLYLRKVVAQQEKETEPEQLKEELVKPEKEAVLLC